MNDDELAAAANRERQASGWVPGGRPINSYGRNGSNGAVIEYGPDFGSALCISINTKAVRSAQNERRELEAGIR